MRRKIQKQDKKQKQKKQQKQLEHEEEQEQELEKLEKVEEKELEKEKDNREENNIKRIIQQQVQLQKIQKNQQLQQLQQYQQERVKKKRKVLKNNICIDGNIYSEVNQKKESLVWIPPGDKDLYLKFKYKEKVSLLTIFLDIVPSTLLEAIRKQLEQDISIKHLYLVLAVSIFVIYLKISSGNDILLRTALTQAKEHFSNAFPNYKCIGINKLERMFPVSIFTRRYYSQISFNFQSIVENLGEVCVSNEKTLSYHSNREYTITDRMDNGIGFYELCAPLQFGGSYLLFVHINLTYNPISFISMIAPSLSSSLSSSTTSSPSTISTISTTTTTTTTTTSSPPSSSQTSSLSQLSSNQQVNELYKPNNIIEKYKNIIQTIGKPNTLLVLYSPYLDKIDRDCLVQNNIRCISIFPKSKTQYLLDQINDCDLQTIPTPKYWAFFNDETKESIVYHWQDLQSGQTFYWSNCFSKILRNNSETDENYYILTENNIISHTTTTHGTKNVKSKDKCNNSTITTNCNNNNNDNNNNDNCNNNNNNIHNECINNSILERKQESIEELHLNSLNDSIQKEDNDNNNKDNNNEIEYEYYTDDEDHSDLSLNDIFHLPCSKKIIPLHEIHRMTMKICHQYNHNLTSFGDHCKRNQPGHEHDFMLTCILQNTINSFVDQFGVLNEFHPKFEYSDYCFHLSHELYEYSSQMAE